MYSGIGLSDSNEGCNHAVQGTFKAFKGLTEEPSDFGASGILSQSAPPHHTSPPPAASTGSIESAGASAHVFLLRRIKIEGDMRPDRGESELCCDANDIKPLGHARLFGNAGSEAGHRRLSRSSFSNTTSSRPVKNRR